MKNHPLSMDAPYFLLGLGSNQGDRAANLWMALLQLDGLGAVGQVSSVYESAPMYVTRQPAFLNMAIGLQTRFTPLELLHHIKAIEAQLGRDLSSHAERFGPRPIDIDILLAVPHFLSGDQPPQDWNDFLIRVDTPELTIPHPRLHERAFALYPLLEITRPAIKIALTESARSVQDQDIQRLAYLGELVYDIPFEKLRWIASRRSDDGDIPVEKLDTEESIERYIRHMIESAKWPSHRDGKIHWQSVADKDRILSLSILERGLRELIQPTMHLNLMEPRKDLVPAFEDALDEFRSRYPDVFQQHTTWGNMELLMINAGYSHRPLAAKLGLTQGMRVALHHAPDDYATLLGDILQQVTRVAADDTAPVDFAHAFYKERNELERDLPTLTASLAKQSMLWISWPKAAANMPTNLTDTIVREIGLAHGLVDVKVCAVDATWSALKFVRRLKER